MILQLNQLWYQVFLVNSLLVCWGGLIADPATWSVSSFHNLYVMSPDALAQPQHKCYQLIAIGLQSLSYTVTSISCTNSKDSLQRTNTSIQGSSSHHVYTCQWNKLIPCSWSTQLPSMDQSCALLLLRAQPWWYCWWYRNPTNYFQLWNLVLASLTTEGSGLYCTANGY